MPNEMDVANYFLVSAKADQVGVLNPPKNWLQPNEALVFAAWLVALAEPMTVTRFEDVRRRVERT